MTVLCSQGHENPDGSAFCDECGERLDAATVQAAPVAAPPLPPDVTAAPAAPAAAPKLVVEADNTTFDLAGKTEVLIGREDPVSNIFPDVDLTPHGGEEGGVSRLHAKLYVTSGQYLIEDQNSTNFTYVNRQKLAPKTPTPVKNGDEIRLGRIIMKFETA